MKKDKAKKPDTSLLLLCFGLLFMLIGASVFLYPKVSNALYEHRVTGELEVFEASRAERETEIPEEKTEEKPLTPLEELYLKLSGENLRLYEEHQNKLVDPWSYQQTAVDLTEYGVEDGIIGYLSIEKMNVVLPILLGASEQNMLKGAVHMTQTSYPIGGENTNCVLAAHRGYNKQDMFRNIHRLKIGDEVVLDNLWETLYYRVVEIQIVEPTEVDKVLIREGRDLLTLLSCNPLGQHTERILVFCERYTPETTAS